jgi:hypothetical protein
MLRPLRISLSRTGHRIRNRARGDDVLLRPCRPHPRVHCDSGSAGVGSLCKSDLVVFKVGVTDDELCPDAA